YSTRGTDDASSPIAVKTGLTGEFVPQWKCLREAQTPTPNPPHKGEGDLVPRATQMADHHRHADKHPPPCGEGGPQSGPGGGRAIIVVLALRNEACCPFRHELNLLFACLRS
ncbi:MAG: hypothetical protein RIQ68_934, partial [Pseudomonadota bacterium]